MLPSIRDEAAWTEPAAPAQVAAAVSHVLAACEPNADEARAGLFARMVASRRYTGPELAYAARELPFDEVVNDKLRFNRPLMPADFERIIKALRQKRARLRRPMTLARAEELAMEFPDEIRIEHFHVSGFDERNHDLVMYAPHLPPRTPAADPAPQEAERRPRQDGRASSIMTLADTKPFTDLLQSNESRRTRARCSRANISRSLLRADPIRTVSQ